MTENFEDEIADKVVQIPLNKWKYIKGNNSSFYFIDNAYRYILYVSGGVYVKLRIQNECVEFEFIEISQNEKLKNYCRSLFIDADDKARVEREKFIMKINDNLSKLINL
jgi:hypothetical protein